MCLTAESTEHRPISTYSDQVVSMPSYSSFCTTSANAIAVPALPLDDDKPKPLSIPPPQLPGTSRAANSRRPMMNRGIRVIMGTYCTGANTISCHPANLRFPQAANSLTRLNRKMLQRIVRLEIGLFASLDGEGKNETGHTQGSRGRPA